MSPSDPTKSNPSRSLDEPCLQDTILEVRTSGMKTMPGLTIQTGIDKKTVQGPIYLSKLGLTGDEHDLTFHGGIDKAVHGYCLAHYPSWQKSFPEAAERFVPGGFGENFVFANMNERNVCIGDVVSVGAEAVLEISLPRSPCFKLNHRFGLKGFAPKTSQSSRTGWYYRVVKEGNVKAGDVVKVVKRPWPAWTIERLQEYLVRKTEDAKMNEILAGIEVLGEEARGKFQDRIERVKKDREEKEAVWTDFEVVGRKMESSKVVRLTLENTSPNKDLERIPLASHVSIKLPNGLVRSYSVLQSQSGNDFELGIALDANTRGGSKAIHDSVHVGSIIPTRITRRDFKNAAAASNHCFIVGGIGITAFLSLATKANAINYNFTIHYGVKSKNDVPFKAELDPLGDHVVYYDSSKGERMKISEIVKNLPWNSHVYVCGPTRMMDDAREAIKEAGLDDNEVHFEAFQADISGDPFTTKIVNKNKTVQVSGTESLLQVLRREFDDIPSSCEVGNCGTCQVRLRNGRVLHKGTALSAEEKETTMLSCISRGIGNIEIEI